MSTTHAPYLGREDAVPGFEQIASGKVRDVYRLDERRLLFVATDRISAFDVVMNEGVADKGRVLTHVAAWWFTKTRDLVPNHMLSAAVEDVPGLDREWRAKLAGRVMVVERALTTSVEWVVRGYMAGSGWKDYRATGSICGVPLPPGLELASRLPEPILTPTTKDEDHDRPLSIDEARARVGAQLFEPIRAASFALFERGRTVLERIGVLLADTKFEFGTLASDDAAGIGDRPYLIDEALTPDSSRFWPASEWVVGTNQPSYDKQILRDWLETLDWNKEYPAPALDAEILARVRKRYLEICEKLTGSTPAATAH